MKIANKTFHEAFFIILVNSCNAQSLMRMACKYFMVINLSANSMGSTIRLHIKISYHLTTIF